VKKLTEAREVLVVVVAAIADMAARFADDVYAQRWYRPGLHPDAEVRPPPTGIAAVLSKRIPIVIGDLFADDSPRYAAARIRKERS
jgi:hypothetical protein